MVYKLIQRKVYNLLTIEFKLLKRNQTFKTLNKYMQLVNNYKLLGHCMLSDRNKRVLIN